MVVLNAIIALKSDFLLCYHCLITFQQLAGEMPEQEIAIAQGTTPRNYKSFEEKLGCRGCTIDNAKWERHSDVFALLLLVVVGWAIGYSLFGGDVVGIHSQMFSLVVRRFYIFVGFVVCQQGYLTPL